MIEGQGILAHRAILLEPPKMHWWRVIKEVLTPGAPEFKAHLTRLSNHEAELVKALQKLDQPAIREVKDATDEAAEF